MSVVLFRSAATITEPAPACSPTSDKVTGNRFKSRRQSSMGCGQGPATWATTTVGSIETPVTRICAVRNGNV